MSLRLLGLAVAWVLAAASSAMAEWSVTAGGNLFYTDDVALFSATRRLNLHGDPTQPALDTSLTEKGSDMVFEPDLLVSKSFTSSWGRTALSVKGPGVHLYGESTVQPDERGAGSVAFVHRRTRRSGCGSTPPPISFWVKTKIA